MLERVLKKQTLHKFFSDRLNYYQILRKFNHNVSRHRRVLTPGTSRRNAVSFLGMYNINKFVA